MTLNDLKDLVHGFLGDRATKNRLNNNTLEFDINDIEIALRLALIHINGAYLITTGYTLENCPEHLLIPGVAVQVLSSKITQKARNKIAVNDGGIAVDREGNIDIYMRIYGEISRKFEDDLMVWKGNINLIQGINA